MSFLNSNPAFQVARSLILEPLNCLAGGAKILCGRWKDRLNVIQASLSTMLCSLLHMPPLEEKQTAIVRRQFPFFSSDNFGSQFRNPQDREKLAASLKKAGL